jgi:hypothetical protein
MTHLTARLHPKWVGGRDGYHYSVICRATVSAPAYVHPRRAPYAP